MPRVAARLPLVLVLAGCLGAVVAAPPGEPEARARPFGLRDTNKARFAVLEVRALLKAKDWDRGLREAQRVIDELGEDLFLVEQTHESERWRPAVAEVRDLLLELPSEGRARYDARAEEAAEALRAEALATGSLTPLHTLWRRFGTSTPGVEAARLLVEAALEGGRARDAAALAREALRAAPADPGLWLRLVDALDASSDVAALGTLRPPPGLHALTARGQVGVDERLGEARRRPAPPPPPRERPMWGGRPSRDLGFPAEGARATSLRWSAPTQLTLRDRDESRTWPPTEGDAQIDFAAHLGAYRPMFPATDGDLIYVSDGRSLRALDPLSGRAAWLFDADAADAGPAPLALIPRNVSAGGRTALDRPFAPCVWRDLVIATLELDQPFRPEILMGAQINTYLARRTLVALDRARGTLRWSAGQDAFDRLRLGHVTFSAEAVVADDLVFVVGSRRSTQHDVSLFAFEAATGLLAWETPLAYGQQETNLFGYPVKEFSAGAVSAADGIVYAQTGLGCLAAVEARTGAPLWVASYEIDEIKKVEHWYLPPLRIPQMGPVAPLVRGDLVIVAPGDAMHLSAFDRRTGALRWQVQRGELAVRYHWLGQVLGVARVGGRDALIATGSGVLALDLATGKRIAVGRFDPEGANVVGQGALAGRTVLVPTDAGIQRFSLDGELKLVGRDPWPHGAEPGNLLPLGQVLVVASRERIHGFYDWEDVERELTRRRQERPRDPEVLVEAGEVYLKGRGPVEARRSFEAALALAEPGSAVAERARRGLLAAWTAEAAARAEKEPALAVAAYQRALDRATTPAERVAVRLRLDGVFPPRSAERIENLERLYAEAGNERAGTDESSEALPVRPVALLRLARVEADAGRPRRAIAALQRLLREQADVLLGPERVGDIARRRVDLLVERFGPEAYAEEEALARALLAAAGPDDSAALERVLREYPNASVVPAALLALAEQRVRSGSFAEAADPLRTLLASGAAAPEAVRALALLARAYGALGAFGARKAALLRLADLAGEGRFDLEGRTSSAAELAAAEQAAHPGPAAPAPRPLRVPLTERAAEPPPDEEVALPLPVTDEPDDPCPLALTSRGGGEVLAFDLLAAREAWRVDDLAGARAVYAQGALVLTTRGEWRGLEPASGARRWTREEDDLVQEVAAARGQVVWFGQSRAAGRSVRRVAAFDPVTGLPLWSNVLGTEPVHSLRAAGPWVLLTRTRHEDGESRAKLLVLDGLTGALRHELPLPPGRDARDVVLGGLLVSSAPDGSGRRSVSALDLAAGTPRWTRRLATPAAVGTLVPAGDRVWVLQQDGRLTALAAADGAPLSTTSVSAGGRNGPLPAFATDAWVSDGRLTLLAGSPGPRSGPPLLCFDLASGRLLWEVEAHPIVRPQYHHLAPSGRRWAVLVAGFDAEQRRRVVVRIVDAAAGTVEQTLEPALGPEPGMVALDEGFGTLVVLTNAGTSVYGPADDAPAAPPVSPDGAPPPRVAR